MSALQKQYFFREAYLATQDFINSAEWTRFTTPAAADWLEIYVKPSAQPMLDVRYRAFGVPELLAAAEYFCEYCSSKNHDKIFEDWLAALPEDLALRPSKRYVVVIIKHVYAWIEEQIERE